ncbi:MAG TPA: efflux RND transporter periplasmic adaptor subunit [Methylomirabilota bacterium]
MSERGTLGFTTSSAFEGTPEPTRAAEPAGIPPEAITPGRRRRRPTVWLLAVVALLVASGIAGYLYVRPLARPSPYQAARVVRGPLVASISATGTLNAVITVQVGSQVSGQIKELSADFNSQVVKGQVIARIDPDIFQAQVNQARAQVQAARATVLNQRAVVAKTRADLESSRAALASAHAQTAKALVAVVDGQRNLARQQELRQRALIAQADVDAAQVAHDSAVAQHQASLAQERAQASAVESAAAQLEVAEAQLVNARAQVGQSEAALGQAQVNLDHTTIRAPVNGVVVSRNVDVGQTVAASLQAPTLFQIAQDLTKMQVDTNVDEADVGRVRVGQAVTFTVDSFPGQTFSGDVVQVRKAPQVVQNVVTYDVVVSAPNPELTLLPGMTANVRIVTDRKESVLRLPNAALRFRPAGAGAEVVPAPLPSAGSRSEVVRGLTGQVWVLEPGGRLRAVPLRLGISDGVVTEVLEGELHDQEEVVVGVAAASAAPAPAPAGGPRLRF